MSQILNQAAGQKNANKGKNVSKRLYGIDLLLKIDPDFLEAGELESALAAHEQMAQLLENSFPGGPTKRKDFVRGTVSQASKEGYFVNIGRKYDGFVPLAEGTGLSIGAETEFFVAAGADHNNCAVLSPAMARGWRQLQEAEGTTATFTAKVFAVALQKRSQKVSGLRVVFENGDLKGIRGFVPNIELSRYTNAANLVGQNIDLSVLTAEPQRGGEHGNLVMSQKALQVALDQAAFELMEQGQIVSGKIEAFIKASPKDYNKSALIRLDNGLIGMLHRSEALSNSDSLSDLYKVGDTIETAVVNVDHDKKRISLSLRAAARKNKLSQLKIGDIVDAVILRSSTYGYFVSIGGGVEGLIHQSDLAVENNRYESFKAGDTTRVMLLETNADGSRVAFGRKQVKS